MFNVKRVSEAGTYKLLETTERTNSFYEKGKVYIGSLQGLIVYDPDKENFVKRNRIVAGLSEATIVIESAAKGGSLITADIANSYNRDVFAVPGRANDQYSIGCNQLIKRNKAALITSVNDLEYILNWKIDKDKNPKSIQKKLFIELSDEEKIICNYLIKEGKQSLDVIALHCKYPIQKTATILFNLEMKGVAKPLPGKIFEAI